MTAICLEEKQLRRKSYKERENQGGGAKERKNNKSLEAKESPTAFLLDFRTSNGGSQVTLRIFWSRDGAE